MRETNQPLIELRGVDVALNGATILRDVNWSLRPDEHWMIHGANGSGKSTFLRLVRGDVWPAPHRGERIYRLGGSAQMTAVEVRRYISFVAPESQERYLQQDWRMTARDVIHTGFAQTDMLYVPLAPKEKLRSASLAKKFGITSLLDRDVQTLSTGELRKVLIARAMVGAPRVLLLDEVCDGLDARFRRELLRLIELIARHGTQIVYTTHRTDEALSVITHSAEFQNGRMMVQPRLHSTSRNRRRSANVPRAKFPNSQQDAGGTLIRIENADVFLDRQKVLHGIDWQLRRGEHWAVLGGNGAGKTTFLKLIASDLYPMFGARVSRFEFTADNTIWELRRRIGCVSPLLQTHYRERLTAEQVIVSGFFSSVGLVEKPTVAQRRRARALLKEFGLKHLQRKSMLSLSFGELRKVLTLRALVHEPELLILDEPFDGLDAPARRDFSVALEQIAARGAQLLIVTHHLDDLPRCITHGLFLKNGRIASCGTWGAVRQHSDVVRLFGKAAPSKAQLRCAKPEGPVVHFRK